MITKLRDNLYLPISEYKSRDTFSKIIEILDTQKNYKSTEFGYYHFIEFESGKALPKHGWKIHVSAMNSNATDILKIVAAYCVSEKIDFKFIRDDKLLDDINSKQWNRSSSGKFITIYPRSVSVFQETLKNLNPLLDLFKGPYILSDKRYKNSKVLFYRYGKINSNDPLVGPNGEIFLDEVQPYYQQPEWVKDPIDNIDDFEVQDDESDEVSLRNGRYLIVDVLHDTNCGGVYLALDRLTDEKVVIKEARPYTSELVKGIDAVYLQQIEKEILKEMEEYQLDFVPEYVDYFKEWEHFYLVTTYINGSNLSEDIASLENVNNVKTRRNVDERFSYIYKQLYEKLTKLWELGITHGDITPENILIDSTGKVHIIDFELAISNKIENPAIKYLVTEGFRISKVKDDFSNRFRIDKESFGLTLLRLFCTGNNFVYLDQYIPIKFLNTLAKDGILNDDNQRIIEGLIYNNGVPSNTISNSSKFKDQVDYTLEDIISRSSNFLLDLVNTNNNSSTLFKTVKPSERFSYMDGDFGILQTLKGNHDGDTQYLENIFKEELYRVKSIELSPTKALQVAHCMNNFDMEMECFSVIQKNEKSIMNHYIDKQQNFTINQGLSGVGLLLLSIYQQTNNNYYYERMITIADYMTSEINRIGIPNTLKVKNFNYLGFYNGFSGIPYFLLKAYEVTKKTIYLTEAKRCIDYIISLLIKHPTGTYIEVELGKKAYAPYLSGATGFIKTLNYYTRFNTEYKTYIHDLIEPIHFKYCRNASYIGGLSGMGEVILECYRADSSNEQKYLDILTEINEGINLFSYSYQDYVVFSSNKSSSIDLTYANGMSGVISYLQNVLQIEKEASSYVH